MTQKDIHYKTFTHIMYGLWWAAVSGCMRMVRTGFLVGSRMSFFSGATLFTPLAGYYGGVLGSVFLYLFRVFQSSLVFPQQGYKYYLVYHIPGICAGLYLTACRSGHVGRYLLGCMLPMLCMALLFRLL
jgi:hypothetical protein